MNPLISVIVPVYNGQDYLENCIESINDQTYCNLEIIIVDDGSTDETPVVCSQLASRYCISNENKERRIIVVNQDKGGVSSARNNGIINASGEFITFVDADDRLFPDMLQVLYDCIIESKVAVVGCQFVQWSEEDAWKKLLHGASLERQNGEQERTIYSGYEFKEQIINGNSRCWSKLYSRDVVVNGNVSFDEKITIGEDMLFLAELTKHSISFCELEYQGYGYYKNDNGAMNRKFSKEAMDQILCWEKARDILGASGKLDSIIVISSLLTAGRIAVLDSKEREKYNDEIKIAHAALRKYYSRDIKRFLDKGYQLKALIFRLMPSLYIKMYGIWKN